MVAMGVSFRVGGGANKSSPLGFHHSERVFVAQPPRKLKPSKGLQGLMEFGEHVFDLGGEQAYA